MRLRRLAPFLLAISTLALSAQQLGMGGGIARGWCSTLAEKLAFVSFETGRTTAVASARQNGCIPALLLLKKQCSLQRAAWRAVDAK